MRREREGVGGKGRSEEGKGGSEEEKGGSEGVRREREGVRREREGVWREREGGVRREREGVGRCACNMCTVRMQHVYSTHVRDLHKTIHFTCHGDPTVVYCPL